MGLWGFPSKWPKFHEIYGLKIGVILTTGSSHGGWILQELAGALGPGRPDLRANMSIKEVTVSLDAGKTAGEDAGKPVFSGTKGPPKRVSILF